MVNTNLLELAIFKSKKTKKYLAEKCGISTETLRQKINNVYDFKSSEVAILCDELGIVNLDEKEQIFFAHYVYKNINNRT